jgi:hypothetical protein
MQTRKFLRSDWSMWCNTFEEMQTQQLVRERRFLTTILSVPVCNEPSFVNLLLKAGDVI